MKNKLVVSLGLVALMVMFGACEKLKPIGSRGSRSGAATTGAAKGAAATGDKVVVEMYVMSKCPYGVQAEQGIQPVLDEIGANVDFQLHFIATEEGGKFNSLHGEPEVKGNIQQLCARKHYPELAKWTGFLACQNENWQQIPEGWEPCAKKMNMDAGKLKTCIDGEEGKGLMRESLKKAQAANAQGSPTIKIGGEEYSGGRSKSDFMRAICAKYTGTKPAPCANIPEDIEVVATVLTDKRCAKCDIGGLEANLKSRFFPKLKIKAIDYGTEEGKALYKELGTQYLPIMLFTAEAEKAEKYSQIARWMEQKGKWKQLKIPAQFDPTAEICDNKKDDTANGKVDCEDDTCKNSLVCRTEKPKLVEAFIMSQCPYGVQAVNAMKEVLDATKGQLKFDVHFIADKTETGFNSLHGQPEVDENIRMLCVKKLYPAKNKWLDYYWCRFTGDDWRSTEWKKCAKDGIDAGKIQACFDGEGKKLLEEDIKIAKALDITGSPTWLANNKHKFHGIAASAVQTNVCQHNAGLTGCDKKLTEKAAAVPSGSCGN